jgi:hypothetical protein
MIKRITLSVISMSLLLAICLAGFAPQAWAQQRSNFGKEFYVAFGANQGGDESGNLMALYITSKVVATGSVDVPALAFHQTFTATPGQITTITLPSNLSSASVEITSSEIIYPGLGVHITSDYDIAVFGMNHKTWSSDAFMALPVSVLGSEYRTMNYNSSPVFGNETASEFWFVATQDATTFEITPRAATASGKPKNVKFKVTLDHGEAYMVQGDLVDSNSDLTGSIVKANKPFALFSGHKRARIPTDAYNVDGSVSRDHLCEQIPPMSAWGDSVIVVPFSTSARPDLVRVLSSSDDNQIRVNDQPVATLAAGDFYEIRSLPGVTVISASKPILVGQYMHTSWGSQGNTTTPAYGDPALALVLPVEQFDTAYTIVSMVNPTAFTGNFMNIVVVSGEILPTIYFDDVPLSSSQFHNVPNNYFKYAQIPITQGTHSLHSRTNFGLTIYALGNVDSYAYTGGALVNVLNTLAVKPSATVSCDVITNLSASINPFKDASTVSFDLTKSTTVRFELVDAIGRTVQLDIHSKAYEVGHHAIAIDGASLAAGFYYARLTTASGEIFSVKLRKVN